MPYNRRRQARPTGVYVNMLFEGQRTTGQQRYAGEVARRLAGRPGVSLLSVPAALPRSPAAAHLWAQAGMPVQGARGVLLSMTARSPVAARRHVVVVHDLFPITHPEWFDRRFAVTHAALLRAQLRTASTLAAVSQPVLDQVKELHPRKRVVLAPNAPAHCFPAAAREAGNASASPPGFLLAVGSADPRKNFHRLVSAYLRLPADVQAQHPLKIVGGESRHFAAAGSDIAGNPNIERLGYVEDAVLASLYAQAGAVVVPSLDEGFGLPVVEALAAGAQVVASDIPVFRWVAGERATYFDPTSELSIATALAEAVSRPLSAGQRQDNSRAIGSRFTWDRTADLLYDTCMATA